MSAGIHAGLGRSGKGEGVLIDKTGQEGVLRESPQPCCPLSPHRALAATSRSRSRVVLAECAAQGRVSSGPGIHQLASRRGARIDSRDLPVPYSRRPPQSHGPPPPVLPVRPGACFGHEHKRTSAFRLLRAKGPISVSYFWYFQTKMFFSAPRGPSASTVAATPVIADARRGALLRLRHLEGARGPPCPNSSRCWFA